MLLWELCLITNNLGAAQSLGLTTLSTCIVQDLQMESICEGGYSSLFQNQGGKLGCPHLGLSQT